MGRKASLLVLLLYTVVWCYSNQFLGVYLKKIERCTSVVTRPKHMLAPKLELVCQLALFPVPSPTTTTTTTTFSLLAVCRQPSWPHMRDIQINNKGLFVHGCSGAKNSKKNKDTRKLSHISSRVTLIHTKDWACSWVISGATCCYCTANDGKLDIENKLGQTTFCEVVEWYKLVNCYWSILVYV